MRKLSILTVIALYWLVFNSLFLSHFFIVLFFQGEYLITESRTWIAGIEIVVTLALAGLGIERIIRLKERRTKI